MKAFFMKKLEEKGVGYYILLAASILSLILMIMYCVFAIGAGAFSGGIFVCLLFSFLIGIVLFFFDVIEDAAGIVMAVLLTIAFTLFIGNSIGDFADWMTKINLYGNMNNAAPRFVILVIDLIAMLTAIVSCFFSIKRKAVTQ